MLDKHRKINEKLAAAGKVGPVVRRMPTTAITCAAVPIRSLDISTRMQLERLGGHAM